MNKPLNLAEAFVALKFNGAVLKMENNVVGKWANFVIAFTEGRPFGVGFSTLRVNGNAANALFRKRALTLDSTEEWGYIFRLKDYLT